MAVPDNQPTMTVDQCLKHHNDIQAQISELKTDFLKDVYEVKNEITSLTELLRGALKRIDEQSQRDRVLGQISSDINLIMEHKKQFDSRLDKIETDVTEQKMKPAKKWDNASWIIIGAVLLFIANTVLAKLL